MGVTLESAWAPGTRKNIHAQQAAFLEFCRFFGYQALPASHTTLCVFAEYLSRDFKSPNTIANYISGVRWLHIREGKSIDQFNNDSLKLMIKGLSRKLKHAPRQALPITPDILLDIKRALNMSNSKDVTSWAVFLLGFFLMARKSNLVPDSAVKFDPSKQLTRSDVWVVNDSLTVTMKWSKTNQFSDREHTLPLLAIPNSELCPVQAYLNMIALVPGSADDPLFRYKKGNAWFPLTYYMVQRRLREALSLNGRVAEAFSMHSLRRGGATFAAMCGVPRSYIMEVGDWKSDAVDAYIHNPMEAKVAAAQTIRDSLSGGLS